MKLVRRSPKHSLLRRISALEMIRGDARRLLVRFVYVLVVILLLLLVSSYLVYKFESGKASASITSFWDGLWWAVVTIATVGYGDVVPGTSSGRMVGYVLIVFGFVLLSVFTGLIASLFVEDKIKGAKGLKQIKTHGHVVVCGWNKTAAAFLKALSEKNVAELEICLVMNAASELFEELESRYANLQLKFVRGEATQEEVLRRASINTAAQVIILADQNLDRQIADDRSIIIANTLQYMISKDKITVQLLNPENKSLLQRSGFSDILVYDDLGGYLLAGNILDNSSLCIFGRLLTDKSKYIHTREIPASLVGKSYGELFEELHGSGKGLVLGLISKEPQLELDSIFSDNSSAIDQFIKSTLSKSRRLSGEDKEQIRWDPPADSLIREDDYAIVLGGD